MDKMTEAQQAILTAQHQSWLSHPVTQQLKKLLDGHKEVCINSIISNTSDPTKKEDIYKNAVQLATNSAIQKLIYVTETFVSKS